MNNKIEIAADFVNEWAKKYPVDYDKEYYIPYIKKARDGNEEALRKVTEWKNPRKTRDGLHPWDFRNNPKKETPFKMFLKNRFIYMQKDGKDKLRKDFAQKAPVWSIFWCHILYDTPIFDRYTNIAYHYFTIGHTLSIKDATIKPGFQRWKLYDRYSEWFENVLKEIRKQDPKLTTRDLDRALVTIGEYLIKVSNPGKRCQTIQC